GGPQPRGPIRSRERMRRPFARRCTAHTGADSAASRGGEGNRLRRTLRASARTRGRNVSECSAPSTTRFAARGARLLVLAAVLALAGVVVTAHSAIGGEHMDDAMVMCLA
ncbi:hypothetical protein, partial [Thermoleophilum album]